ncbi:MAG: quinolinate synthase NadA, partial [Candidatus Kryptoniota bacterium]
ARAIETLRREKIDIDPDLIEIYDHRKGKYWSACHVHQQIGPDAADIALLQNADAELMIHPECGCASSCLYKVQSGIIPHEKAYFLSTEQMIEHARVSPAKKFVVATEKGMVYRLRKEMPDKEFIPISQNAVCEYMKANTFEKLLDSLRRDRLEIVFCDNCCEPKSPYQDDRVIHIQRVVAESAKMGIERMLALG